MQIFLFNLSLCQNAYAYFDYGTGSLLIQSMIAGFGVVIMFMNRIKEWFIFNFRRLFGRKTSIDNQSGSNEKEARPNV